MQLSRPLDLVGAGKLHVVERCARRFDVALGEMKINGCRLEIGMPEQRLNGGEIRAAFHQMGGKAVPPIPAPE